MKRATFLILAILLSGCSVTRHTFGLYGVGKWERIDVTPLGQTKPFSVTTFTLDSHWPITLSLVAAALGLIVMAVVAWRFSATSASSTPPSP